MKFDAFRIANYYTPVRVKPNKSGQRYNHSESGPTQYFSLHPLTPWAEFLRAQDRRTLSRLREMRLRYWVLKVNVDSCLELTFESAHLFDLQPEDLISDDHGPCREFAEKCRHDSGMPSALLVPSAALPGTRNLVVLGPQVLSPYESEPIDEGDVPGAVAAEDALSLDLLLPKVRFRGEPHDEFEAWKAGRDFLFSEPIIPGA